MAIEQITDHAGQARARLATQFRGTASHAGVLDAVSRQVQRLEDVCLDLLTLAVITSSIGLQLDTLGKILGRPRGGATDAQYRIFLRGQILLNRSSGTVPDVLGVLSTVLSAYSANPVIGEAIAPAALLMRIKDAIGAADPAALALLLRRARVAGVRGLLEWSAAADTGTLEAGTAQIDGQGEAVPALAPSQVSTGPAGQGGGATFTADGGFALLSRGFSGGGGSVVITHGDTEDWQISTYASATNGALSTLNPAIPAGWTGPLYVVPNGGGSLAGVKEG